MTDKWNECYIGIFRANQVIQNIQEASETLFSDNRKNEIEAEARFLRAFFYFQIVHTYGGGVMHVKVAESDDDFNKPFSSIDDVTNNIIIPDFEFAREHLPEVWPERSQAE